MVNTRVTTKPFETMTGEERTAVAKVFSTELHALAEHWENNSTFMEFTRDYLQDDLRRYPRMIREEMSRRAAADGVVMPEGWDDLAR